VRHYLGGPFDLDPFYAFAETEPVLAGIVPELRASGPPLSPDPYETLVSAITAQQISLRRPFAVRNRFIQAFGVQARLAYAFPTGSASRSPSRRRSSRSVLRRKGRVRDRIARSDLDLLGLAAFPTTR
jgi:3-methyladenine DNA glycosylase/8-oxoguanine DNA glycosylase